MKFEEEYLFEKFKDKCIGSAQEFKNRVSRNHKNVDADKLYKRVLNYQIKTYGGTIYSNGYYKSNRFVATN